MIVTDNGNIRCVRRLDGSALLFEHTDGRRAQGRGNISSSSLDDIDVSRVRWPKPGASPIPDPATPVAPSSPPLDTSSLSGNSHLSLTDELSEASSTSADTMGSASWTYWPESLFRESPDSELNSDVSTDYLFS